MKIISIVIQFGTIISDSAFKELINNEIIFTNENVFCVTESGHNGLEWTFRENSIDSTPEIQSATSWSAATSVSSLSVNTMQQGYYTCKARQDIVDIIYFTVGVFNSTKTTGICDCLLSKIIYFIITTSMVK